MVLSVHQPQYIAWIGYFHKILRSDAFVFLDNVQYKPREYQNRNRIRTKDGALWLSVPVSASGLGRQAIREVKIDDSSGWRADHLNSIRTSYGRAKYFARYFPFFEDLYGKIWDDLCGLNIGIIKYIMKEMSISTPLYMESELGIASKKTDRIVDICGKLNADTYLSGIGGKGYLEEDKFRDSGITLRYQEFRHPVYGQQFMKDSGDFMPYMSAVDLLFNEGPDSAGILRSA